MPETRAGKHWIPVRSGCEVTATIVLSKEKGISALYCGEEKLIHTYIFDEDEWPMDEAKEWVEKRKARVSEGEFEIVDVVSEEAGGEDGGGTAPGTTFDTPCRCPECGYEEDKQAGVPCRRILCPECGAVMMRALEGEANEDVVSEEPSLVLSLPAAERLAKGDLTYVVHMGDLEEIALSPVTVFHEGKVYARAVLSRPVCIGADIFKYEVMLLETYDPPMELEESE